MNLSPRDIEATRRMFEDVLRRTRKVGRVEKMKLRSSVRRELSLASVLAQPTPEGLLSRWEEKLSEVFSIMSHRFKDDLKRLIFKQINAKKQKQKKCSPRRR